MKVLWTKATLSSFILPCLVATVLLGTAPVVYAEEIDGIDLGEAVVITASVLAVDKGNRVVTLRGPEGSVVDIEVGEEATNFDQIDVGDEVNFAYYQSVALYLGESSEAPEATAEVVATRASEGDKPAGLVVGVVDASATIMAIDLENRAVTLELPDGEIVTTPVAEGVRPLDSFKVGDTVHARLTKAVAISVD